MKTQVLAALFLLIAMPIQAADKPAYRVLAADNGKVAIVAPDGKVEWTYANKAETHDLWMLPNGNVLLPIGRAAIGEVTPKGEVVWKYECQPKKGYIGRIEVH